MLEPKWLELCNAVAGGVLISVALVHMLDENSKELAEFMEESVEESDDYDHDEHDHHHHGFPLGHFLAMLGFFTIIGLEKLLGDGHSHHNGHGHRRKAEDATTYGNATDEQAYTPADVVDDLEELHGCPRAPSAVVVDKSHERKRVVAAGTSAVVGLTVHSLFEAVALGMMHSDSAIVYMSVVFSIAIHKFFEVPAIFAVFLPVFSASRWWCFVTLYAFVTPVGLIVGMLSAESIESAIAAGLQCFAAGTLLAVGINDMLMPSLNGTQWLRLKLLASVGIASFLSVLPAVMPAE
eukprot:TRINITY_DN47723_c0_g1_i2.p1 TRINITY_DN47723_c0_g1~~TRINITY_DN47723_c0_g1_i2.p1  ORF type:complete len:294 (-),score=61.10 TRINITY_DN47723_c0_g1_i2:62-943(-)